MKWFALLAGLSLVAFGCSMLLSVGEPKAPVTISLSEFAKGTPTANWVSINHVVYDLTRALLKVSRFKKEGNVKAVFVPLTEKWPADDSTIHVLVVSRDPRLLKIANDLTSLRSKNEVLAFLEKNWPQLIRTTTVTGLLRRDEGEMMDVAMKNHYIGTNCVFLDEGVTPDDKSMEHGGLAVFGGLILLVWVLMNIRKGDLRVA
jgi:hypothetical protein